jgi:hypothetical protein
MSRILLILAALIGFASPANAYWEYGHQTVAAIAYRNVTPKVRLAINRMLAETGPMLETPECPARTIEEASVWADCIKKLGPRFKYASAWHYQDVDICAPFDLKPPCKDDNCVSAQIERDMKLLKDKRTPERDRVQALVFLIHFVGDLHQPLHAGERHDQGGNKVKATYGIYTTDRLNLHSVWDGLLAERAISMPPAMVRAYSASVRNPIQAGTVEDWSRESWQVAHDTVYTSAFGGDPCTMPANTPAKLDDATIASLVKPARLQVLRGGLRLAKVLNETLG